MIYTYRDEFDAHFPWWRDWRQPGEALGVLTNTQYEQAEEALLNQLIYIDRGVSPRPVPAFRSTLDILRGYGGPAAWKGLVKLRRARQHESFSDLNMKIWSRKTPIVDTMDDLLEHFQNIQSVVAYGGAHPPEFIRGGRDAEEKEIFQNMKFNAGDGLKKDVIGHDELSFFLDDTIG